MKVDAGVRAAVVGDIRLHSGSHFVPLLPFILRMEVLGYPTLSLFSFLTTLLPNPQAIQCPRCFVPSVKSALSFLTLWDPGLDTCLSPRSSVQGASQQWAG